MRRRTVLSSFPLLIPGCSSLGASDQSPDTTRSVNGTEIELTKWADGTASYGGPYSATHVTATEDPPVAGLYTATFDDGSQERGSIPGDPERYGEHGEEPYHSPGASGAEPDELSGWIVYHPDREGLRIESVTVDPLSGGGSDVGTELVAVRVEDPAVVGGSSDEPILFSNQNFE